MRDKRIKVKFVCKEDCGNSPKKLFLRNFNIAAAKVNLPYIKRSLTDDVVWHLSAPAGQKNIFGFSNGGSTALQIAIRHPKIVRKLVIASAIFTRDGMPPQFWEWMKHAS